MKVGMAEAAVRELWKANDQVKGELLSLAEQVSHLEDRIKALADGLAGLRDYVQYGEEPEEDDEDADI